MKKTFSILVAVLVTASSFAQFPDNYTYQAVIRNSANNLVVNTNVGIRISILNSINNVLFSERHVTMTNANGLVSLKIGTGGLISGNISAIDWSTGTYKFKIETDPTGGFSYTITGFSDILPVPIATYSETAGPKYKIGESAQGGIVFFVDATGKHGLVAAASDVGVSKIKWYNKTIPSFTGTIGDGLYDGAMSTAIIVAILIADYNDGSFAARLCAMKTVTYDGITYGDWYLPSKYELNLLYLQKSAVGGFASAFYWSCTEYLHNSDRAWGIDFGTGNADPLDKYDGCYVRAVRAF